MLGRFSKDPEYTKRGRGRYPKNQGAIQKAWRSGKESITNLPDPKTHESKYLQALLDDWGIPKGIARKLRMKSRSYYAKAIDDNTGKRVAVIVYESTKPDRINGDQIEEIITNNCENCIRAHIEKHKGMEPDQAFAKREGF